MRHVGLLLGKNRRDRISDDAPADHGSVFVRSLDIERAARIAMRQPRSWAGLALLGDKQFIFSHSGDAFLMYRRSGRCFVAMGDPVGPESEWRKLIDRCHILARARGGWSVFYQVEPLAIDSYRAQGLSCVKLGEEAIVDLQDFSMDGSHRRRLRQRLRRTERGGGSLEIMPARWVRPMIDTLRTVSDAWLGAKNTREKSFSLGSFEPEYLSRCPIAVVKQRKRVVAFANLWQFADGGEPLQSPVSSGGLSMPKGSIPHETDPP